MTDCTGCHDGLLELPRDSPVMGLCVSATECGYKGMIEMPLTQRCECARGLHYAPELGLASGAHCIPMTTTETTDWTSGPNEWEDQSGDHTETTDWTEWTMEPIEWEDQSGDQTIPTAFSCPKDAPFSSISGTCERNCFDNNMMNIKGTMKCVCQAN